MPVIAVGNLTGMGFREDGLYFITKDKANQLARYDVHAGDVLFAFVEANTQYVSSHAPVTNLGRGYAHFSEGSTGLQ